jgi:biopolymer transport protein ExbD
MADISSAPVQTSGKKVRIKKMSMHIEMTPMVDLAFLLVAFFILTVKLTDPVVIPLVMLKTEEKC